PGLDRSALVARQFARRDWRATVLLRRRAYRWRRSTLRHLAKPVADRCHLGSGDACAARLRQALPWAIRAKTAQPPIRVGWIDHPVENREAFSTSAAQPWWMGKAPSTLRRQQASPVQ